MPDKDTNAEGNEWSFKDCILYLLVAVSGSLVALAAFRLGLAQIGFTAAGVAANLIAAVVYGGAVAATSTLAVLLSIGAAGLRTRAGLVFSWYSLYGSCTPCTDSSLNLELRASGPGLTSSQLACSLLEF